MAECGQKTKAGLRGGNGEKMKVAIVLAIHRRRPITLLTLERYKKQTIPVQVVAVGDSDFERKIADDAGVHYVERDNLPLAAKYQAGVEYARSLNPDAVMTGGSDSWVTYDWCQAGMSFINNMDAEVVGKSIFAACNLDTMEVVERGYKPPAEEVPDGNGRMVSKGGLDKMEWVLYPNIDGVHGIDSASHNVCLNHGLRVCIMNAMHDTKVLEIKSSKWKSVNSFRDIRNSPGLYQYPVVDDVKKWMGIYFPDGYDALEAIK
jgi:hypothetical protein